MLDKQKALRYACRPRIPHPALPLCARPWSRQGGSTMAAGSESNGSSKTRKRRARTAKSSEATRKRSAAASSSKAARAAAADDSDSGEGCGFDVAQFLDTRAAAEPEDSAPTSLTLPAEGVQIRITRDEITI